MLIVKILVAAIIIVFIIGLAGGIIDTVRDYIELRRMRKEHYDYDDSNEYIIKEDDDNEHLH